MNIDDNEIKEKIKKMYKELKEIKDYINNKDNIKEKKNI